VNFAPIPTWIGSFAPPSSCLLKLMFDLGVQRIQKFWIATCSLVMKSFFFPTGALLTFRLLAEQLSDQLYLYCFCS
jgi:hypothetical protein